MEDTNVTKKLIGLYQNLQHVLKSEEYEKDLRNEVEVSYPNLYTVLEQRIKDLEKTDLGIVIAGETSSGKTTLVNKILGKDIFTVSCRESTSTICKLRNSERIQIIAEKNGERSVTDLTDRCDLKTENGVSLFRETLKEFVDVTCQPDSREYNSVDVGFPIPILQGNTILVDSPGIGGTQELTPKLMEYMPNAVSFLFVINVGSAGGMQVDRLPEIMKSLVSLLDKNEMPCFNPEDVIFVTNKWDTIKEAKKEDDTEDDSDDDEDEKSRTWKDLKSKILDHWPSVKEKNIFKMSLRPAKPLQQDIDSTATEFTKFMNTLKENIQKADNLRVDLHLKFCEGVLDTISNGADERIILTKISEDKQKQLADENNCKINKLLRKCTEAAEHFEKRITTTGETIAQSVFDYMSDESGKNAILNPRGCTELLKLPLQNEVLRSKVVNRVYMHVKNVMKSEDVANKFKNIINEIDQSYKNILLELFAIEGLQPSRSCYNMIDSLLMDGLEGIPLGTLTIWLRLVVVVTAFIPLVTCKVTYDKKKTVIDDEYEKWKLKICDIIRSRIESSCGDFLRKIVDRELKHNLPNKILTLQKRTRQLLEKREEYLANHEFLRLLAEKITRDLKTVREIKTSMANKL